MGSDYFPIHAHSEWSVLDGMGTVMDMVDWVASLGQPGLALTDHGTMAGSIRLYKQCQKLGIAPFPGEEFYVVRDVTDHDTRDTRYHLGMVALDLKGYQALVKLSSLSHQRDRFHRKPLIDLSDLAFLHDQGYADHIAVTTGCYFGLVVQHLIDPAAVNGGLNMIRMLKNWFPHLYVEVQDHGINHGTWTDRGISSFLLNMAERESLPVVLGQDSHYCEARHQPIHDLMKDISYFGDGEDNRFPGGPYHLADVRDLKGPWDAREWDRIEEGHSDLLDKHRLKMPALDRYKFHVPEVSQFPREQLKRKLDRGAIARNLDQGFGLIGDYASRVKYELNVIHQMGMENYFLLIEEVTDWCRRNQVIVQARGSANGSLVCYLLGITEVDPLQWGTDFDRFLSLDRKKPPDIDLDVESKKRGLLIEHLRHRHPNMVQIGTYQRLGITESETADGYGEDRGSVYVQYVAAMSRKEPGFNGQVKPEHRATLNRLSDMKVRKSLGVHAAGIVLPTHDHPVSDYIPTALVPSSNTTVTQVPMDDVEDCGYVKGDFLGLRQLETLSGALQNIGRKPNEWDWMPWDDPDACKLLRSGNCDGIFQFSGPATTRGGKEMGVKSTMDAIICLALYRPALMNGGQKDLYLQNRRSKRVQQIRLHPTFDPILDITAGVPIFQEQVMQICRHIGMAYEDWNDLMKGVKASNDKIEEYAKATFERIKPLFQALCIKKGLTKREAEDTWDSVVGFTDYGFNRAHATGYGITAYRSAYLKAHYPLEFMASLLNVWAGNTDEKRYIREARRLGIAIGKADVNLSDIGWAVDTSKKKPTLRKGFKTLHGIGQNVAEAIIAARPDGGWQTMEDFVDAVPARPVSGGKDWKKNQTLCGVMEKLKENGALTSLGVE